MNMAIENRYRAESLDVRQRLGTVIGAPAPVRIDRPERDVGKQHNRRAVRLRGQIFFQPAQLLVAEQAEAAWFQVEHVDQPDEVHALLIEAVPAETFRSFAVSLEIQLSVVAQAIVFAGDVKDLAGFDRLEDLVHSVKLRR